MLPVVYPINLQQRIHHYQLFAMNFAAILVFFKNKFILAGLIFLVWMLFFDPKDWRTVYSRSAKLKALHRSEQKMNTQITETRKELQLLQTNAATIEKYAREKYFMKKDNEELFIVHPKKDLKER